MATLEAVQNSNIQQLSSPYIKPYPRPWLINGRTSRLQLTKYQVDSGASPWSLSSPLWIRLLCRTRATGLRLWIRWGFRCPMAEGYWSSQPAPLANDLFGWPVPNNQRRKDEVKPSNGLQ